MFKRLLIPLTFITLMILGGCSTTTLMNSESTTEVSTVITTNPNSESLNSFESVNLITENPTVYEKVEFALIEDEPTIKENGNPFDYQYMKIIGKFTSPSGSVIEIPAFWTRDYDIILDEKWTGNQGKFPEGEPTGLESVIWKGIEHYRIRFLPEEVGLWTYSINVTENNVVSQVINGQIEVSSQDLDYKGRLQVEPTFKRNFIFEDGSTFIPLGQNTGWYADSGRKTYDYEVWFKNMSENGANATRVWMAPWSFALHWGKSYEDFSSRLNAAARLDRVISLAEENDIYMLLTLLNHGQFSATVNPEWQNNPWNVAKGGFLNTPSEFFYNEQAKEIYKSQLLYIIARWGYSNHIMAWELWNEVDWTDGYSYDGYLWHKEMSQFVKEIDPYHHMVTSSFKGETNSAYNLENIDFVNPHNYGYTGKNFNTSLPQRLDAIWNMYDKPVFHSEIGINWESGYATSDVDPTGISIHQQNWSGMMSGGAGGAMNWWWDSWVHPKNLYYRFKGASSYADEMNMVGNNYSQLRTSNDVSISDDKIGVLGYKIDERIYAYFYHKDWKYTTPNVEVREGVTVSIPFNNGSYTLSVFDTVTGEVINEEELTIQNQVMTVTFDKISNDIAIIID